MLQSVALRTALGIHGDTGVDGREQVHFEVRKGRHDPYACGANDPTGIESWFLAGIRSRYQFRNLTILPSSNSIDAHRKKVQ